MANFLSILFAYRNRDLLRVKNVMESLNKQTNHDFEVIFVDYGSDKEYSEPLQALTNKYSFMKYYYVAHPGLLWNKSKAFNFGIRKAETDYIMTADVDLLFPSDFVSEIKTLCSSKTFSLFSYGYLSKSETRKVREKNDLSELKPTHYGEINGAGLYQKSSLEDIQGFDEFYHFYGSEDEDLFIRLENSGLKRNQNQNQILLHQWHERFTDIDENKLCLTPRIRNIRRINQQHMIDSRDSHKTIPASQSMWGSCYSTIDAEALMTPDIKLELNNLSATVIHFLNEKLNSFYGNIISVNFKEDEKFKDFKFYFKKRLKRNNQPLLSLKEINDEILKKIIFQYRHHNYFYKIEKDMKSITFILDLRNLPKN